MLLVASALSLSTPSDNLWNLICLATKALSDSIEFTGTHTHLTTLCPGLPGWAGTRKVKPIWILLEQETVSGSGISWTVCKSAPCSRQITMPAPTTQFFTGRMPFLPPNQQCQSTEGLIEFIGTIQINLSIYQRSYVRQALFPLWTSTSYGHTSTQCPSHQMPVSTVSTASTH